MVDVIEKEGFNIIGQGRNAEEGAKLSIRNEANLLIIEILMPKVSGLDLLQVVRNNHFKGYAIVTSSLPPDDLIVESLKRGAVDFLRRPFVNTCLIRSIEHIDNRMNRI